MGDLVDDLRSVLDDAEFVVEPDVRATFETDWTGRYGGTSIAVVRPGSVGSIVKILEVARLHRAAIVPQGGNTGLVGGSVPRASAERATIVLSTRSLDDVGDVDVGSMQVSLGAGATIADWRAAARSVGKDAPVDFAARDSATIGGAIATNAGGSRVLRFGTMRSQVVGVEAVLADGSVVGAMSGLPKETAGLHWPSLLSGSEGTLGIVTRARVRVIPWFDRTTVAMVSTASVDGAVELLARLRALTSLDAVELIQPAALSLVAHHLGAEPPVEVNQHGAVVLIECADHRDPTDELMDVIGSFEAVGDSAVATDATPRAALVSFRDRVTEAIAAASTEIGVPTFKLDVAVPLRQLGHLLEVAQAAADDDGCRLIPFGHLAEGNVHLNHLGASDPERLADRVLGAVAAMGGTISAEHGIGVAKSRYLHLIRATGDLAAQRAIKSALDPFGVLNPGVLGT